MNEIEYQNARFLKRDIEEDLAIYDGEPLSEYVRKTIGDCLHKLDMTITAHEFNRRNSGSQDS